MRSRKNLLATLVSKISGPRDAAILISGSPGAGKSWVLDRLSDRLAGQPHTFLRTSPGESDWPLSGVMMLLSNLELDEQIDLEPFLPTFPGEPVDTFAVARHLQVMLPERLKPGTVVLLDDLDLMDPASLKVISFLATKMQRIRTKFVGTITRNPVPAELAAIQVIKLHELTGTESLDLARQHAGPAADTSVLSLVTAQAHGVPGAILAQLEMLTHRQLRGQSPLCLPLHPTIEYTAALPSLLASLDPGQERLLQLAAMGPLCERAALLGIEADPDGLDELLHQGLLETVGPYVELRDTALRSAVYWSLAVEHRRELHGQLQAATSCPALRMFHHSFVHSARVPAIDLAQQAKELLLGGQVTAAVEVSERSLNLASTDPRLPTVLTDLAAEFFLAVRLETAQRYLRFAQRRSPDAATELRLATLHVEIAAIAGRPAPEVDVSVLVSTHQQDHAAACGKLLAATACAHALREEAAAARTALDGATALLNGAATGQQVRLTQAKILLAALELDHATVLGMHQQLLVAPGDGLGLEVKQSLALALLNTGYHQEAREVLSRLTPAGSEPNLLMQRLTLLLSAANAIQNENLPRAMALVERWIAVDGPALLEPMPQLIQAWYWMNKNRQDMAGAYFESMQPHVMGEMSPKLLARISMLAGDNALMNAQHERAVEAYRRTLHIYQGAADIRYVRTTTHLIEALVMLGRAEEAVAEYRARQHQMNQVPGRRAKLTMRLAQAMVLESEASLPRFRALIEEWTPSDSPFELARVRHALGNRLRAMGQPEAAREHLVAARSLYRSLGAKAWVVNVEDCLAVRNPVAAASAPVDLSREEFEVVRMVHEGLTNKAIAKELYISVSAVEARLTKLYRRTGAKNRQQLAARFVDTQPSGAV
ncbi:LuxR C-terminal-related transcriptional regulator [Glutamicibacter sp. MNS18]|uniref:helix-turn-helix transcriptional regulator n=1 Tax=Glutamicibacter sp. MNS18 TaxID=2989817 RepID=UPI0022354DFB|nr:LuxR C-terminal-related transcriptional regulator [Glutamicibacter sp. MNS18]MCW4466247.1 LuxR C-terminal-related transcriptional regulator [Glutamicibacter sp. MNS18]